MFPKRPILLASMSERRNFLMHRIGIPFTNYKLLFDEHYPLQIKPDDVACFLARQKATHYIHSLTDEILITADTTVILDDIIFNKPKDYSEAMAMLIKLQNRTHAVITSVCFTTRDDQFVLREKSRVTFRPLTDVEIKHYIINSNPYDKAGAYGIQECVAYNQDLCSAEETAFLERINAMDLIRECTSTSVDQSEFILRLEGSFFNVMGLPIHRVYQQLENMK